MNPGVPNLPMRSPGGGSTGMRSPGGSSSYRTGSSSIASQLFERFRQLSKAFTAADINNDGTLDAYEIMKLCTRFEVMGSEVCT